MQPTIIQPGQDQPTAPPTAVPIPTPEVAVASASVPAPAPVVAVQPQPEVTPTAPPQPATNPTPATPSQSQFPDFGGVPPKKHTVLKLVAAAVVLLVVFAGGFFASAGITSISQSNAKKAAQSFVAALNAGNNQQAYAMTSPSLKKQQSEATFATNVGDVKATKPVVTDSSIAFNGGVATYIVSQNGLAKTANGSTTGTFTIALVKDGLLAWKVDSVSVQ